MLSSRHAIIAVSLAGLLLAGCKPGGDTAGSGGTSSPPVKIRAYINVSSGCQAATVELLQQLVAEHPERVTLDLVDFGDGAEGARRWQESGHTCMTIEINGAASVQYPGPAGPVTTTFQMPAGFLWTHDDLKAAVAAALAGNLKPVNPDEALAAQPAQVVKIKWAARELQSARDGMAALTADGRPVLRLTASVAGQSPLHRAQAAAAALTQWTAQPVKLADLTVQQEEEKWVVKAGPKVVLIATAEEARALDLTAEKLTRQWLDALRHVLVSPGAATPSS